MATNTLAKDVDFEAVEDAALPGRGARLVSLDAFRGITIAAMILVNNPGNWSAVYPPLLHASWHGWTPTDLIFPFFLFIVGVAVAFAYQKRLAAGAARGPLLRKAIRRSAILFALGLMLVTYPFAVFYPEFGWMDLETFRIPGVLQRIAVCYLAVSLLYIYTSRKWEIVFAFVVLFGYAAALAFIPVPGFGAGAIDAPEGTLTAYVDRMLFGNHLWAQTDRVWDPSGFLGTLPAIVTTLIGVWAGRLLLSGRAPLDKTARMLVWGLAALTAGYVWDWFLPINKGLWTSSYVMFTGGLALCGLGGCYWIADVRGRSRWTKPFVVFGVNAITIYVVSELLGNTIGTLRVGDGISLKGWVFQNVFAPLASPPFASLLYAIAWVLLMYLVVRWMYGRSLIVKV
jgi:predicted acyltransferase